MMRRIFRELGGAVAFLTMLPLRGQVGALSPAFFVVAGAMVGAALWVSGQIGSFAHHALVVGVVVVLVDAGITRGLHYDAVADTADGLAGFVERSRRLEIMDEPTVGAFGVLAMVLTIAARIAAFSLVAADFWLLVFVVSLSRVAMALVLIRVRSARPAGITRLFGVGSQRWILAVVVVEFALVVVSMTLVLGPMVAAVAVLGLLVAGGVVLDRSIQVLGGVTGDVIGAVGIVGETAALLVVALVGIHAR
ncbi:MAG: adenosylcobinamide-GDP ribazoletransferase [Ferrimicrobium sp.]